MANRFLNNIRINDAYTFPASDGNDGQVITTDGAGNLAFENISPDAASVIYRDNFTGDGSTATFDLQNSITDEDQTQIYIDGVYQEKSTYSISGTTITFTTAPISGHSVEVISISSINTGPTVLYQDNFTGNGNDTAFTLGQEIDNEIKTFIFLNGVYQFKNTYTVDGTTLTFDTAPANGVAIEVVSIASAVQSDSLEAGSVIIPVKNTHTASIAKGTPVYITGNVGASERLQIAPADASNSAKMPAAGLLLTTLAVNAEGYVITGGYLRNITTDTIDGTSTSSNDTVYVKSGGGLTMTKPTGSNLIQNIAKVARSASGNSGSLIVSSILRTNDIPNLTTGKIWVGSANNTIESGTLYLDESNNRLGINNNNPSYSLDVTGDANISSNVIVGGNLTVQGTETILNTQTVEVEDNILQLNTTQGSPDTATATTSGISIYRGNGVTQASFIFDDADDTWDLTNNLAVAGTVLIDGVLNYTGLEVRGTGASRPAIQFSNVNQGDLGIIYGTESNALVIGTGTSGATALTIDSSQNATFAGNATIETGINLESGVLVIKNATGDSSGLRIFQDTSDASKIYNNYNGTLQLGVGNTTAITIDSSENTTFAGDVMPAAENAHNIGSAAVRWEDLYVDDGFIRNAYIDDYIYHNGDVDTYINFSPDTIKLATAGGFGFELDSNRDINSPDRLYMRQTYFGYSGGYKVVQFGNAAATSAISLGYNPSGNTSGNFTGDEILIPHNKTILAPNAADNNYYGVLRFNNDKLLIGSSNYLIASNYIMALDPATQRVGIGTTSPTNLLDIKSNGNSKGLDIHHSNGNIVAQLIHGGSGDEGQLKLYDSNSETVRISGENNIDSFINSGNVGIGTTSPSVKFEVKEGHSLLGGTQNNYGGNIFTTTLGGYGVLSTGTDRYGSYGWLTFNANNNYTGAARKFAFTNGYQTNKFALLIGGSGPTDPTLGSQGDISAGQLVFHVNNSADFMFGKVAGDGNGPHFQVNSYSYTSTFQGTSTSDMVTFKTGTELNSNVGAIVFRDNGSDYCGQITVNGSTNTVQYLSASDYRLKEDFKDFNGIDLVDKINVYDFKWKKIDIRSYGVVAHELKEILPQVVNGNKDEEKYQTVDYGKIVPILIKSIKELKAEIETLKTQING